MDDPTFHSPSTLHNLPSLPVYDPAVPEPVLPDYGQGVHARYFGIYFIFLFQLLINLMLGFRWSLLSIVFIFTKKSLRDATGKGYLIIIIQFS